MSSDTLHITASQDNIRCLLFLLQTYIRLVICWCNARLFKIITFAHAHLSRTYCLYLFMATLELMNFW